MGQLERWAAPFRGVGNALAGLTRAVYRGLGGPGRLLQDLMNGSVLGHSLHAMLTDAVVGAVTALFVLDAAAVLFGADVETAAMIVLGFGALSAWGAAAAGFTDHKDIDPGDARNVATLHGLVNLSATLLYTIAFFVRLAGGVDAGRWIALVALVLISGGSFVGGHLVYKWGVMVNHNASATARRAKEFTAVMPAAELAEGKPTRAMLGSTALVLVRRGDLVQALQGTCSHAGGHLWDGTVEGDTIVCPWHASVFGLANGAVKHGPAGTRLAAYTARINEGQVEVEGPVG